MVVVLTYYSLVILQINVIIRVHLLDCCLMNMSELVEQFEADILGLIVHVQLVDNGVQLVHADAASR